MSWRIGVIGAGRVGATLARALRDAGHVITAVAGESVASRARAAALLPGVLVEKPDAVAASCRLLLLAVPDDRLASVVATLVDSGAITADHVVAHTSGRHGLGVLAPAAAVGATTIALHPAMTFTGTERDLERLPGTVFGVTSLPDVRGLAQALIVDLQGTAVWIAEAERGLYHAGLAHGANHLVTLVTQAIEILSAAGVETPAEALRPLLSAALDRALNEGHAALTGPIVRGDSHTVRAHLDELIAHAPDTVPSYVALAHSTLERVRSDGRVCADDADHIRVMLNRSLQRVDQP